MIKQDINVWGAELFSKIFLSNYYVYKNMNTIYDPPNKNKYNIADNNVFQSTFIGKKGNKTRTLQVRMYKSFIHQKT